jgi:uncharacterized DUF497 family protein
MGLKFEWDEDKAVTNAEKHGVKFEEAATVFGDGLSLTIADALHSEGEERYISMGRSSEQRVLVVVHLEDDDRIRIISAREATSAERKQYEEG